MPWPGPGMGGCMVVNSAGGECGLISTWDEWGDGGGFGPCYLW